LQALTNHFDGANSNGLFQFINNGQIKSSQTLGFATATLHEHQLLHNTWESNSSNQLSNVQSVAELQFDMVMSLDNMCGTSDETIMTRENAFEEEADDLWSLKEFDEDTVFRKLSYSPDLPTASFLCEIVLTD
jgi:hypothetical protein